MSRILEGEERDHALRAAGFHTFTYDISDWLAIKALVDANGNDGCAGLAMFHEKHPLTADEFYGWLWIVSGMVAHPERKEPISHGGITVTVNDL